ncbi:MAG: GTP-binding protein [Woeseiaceae bacterium]|nr:GTP-binding protein [Woeseiaceae bacterium]
MSILKRVFAALPQWRWKKKRKASDGEDDDHLTLARESLRELIDDSRLPAGVRDSLAHDYDAVESMLEKIEHGHIHLAVFGRVSTGKSSLLNALIGEQTFSVSPLHGETKFSSIEPWSEVETGGVFLIDTPGLDEAGGESREQLAKEVTERSDLVMFVVDGDITESELESLRSLLAQGRPVIVVLNKSDLFTSDEKDRLLATLRERTDGFVDPDRIVAVSAQPRPQTVVEIDSEGHEQTSERPREPDIEDLRLMLWDILQAEGKTLAALNASLFAADLSDQVGRRILAARAELGDRLVRTYCVGKGVAVALNPIPVADLFAAAFIDVGMVVHLSRVYGLPLNRREAGSLVGVIAAESAAIMATVWAIHLGSSALKLGTAGLSTVATAAAQGAVAYYSTLIVGRVAAEYLSAGKSWGDGGPKNVVQSILDSLDRDTVLKDAKREIKARLKGA